VTELARHHSLPDIVRRRLQEAPDQLAAANITAKRGQYVADLRSTARLEPRSNDDGTVSLAGYATTWETWYDVAGGAPYGWEETIARGSANKSLQARDVVHFLYDHEGMPMASNKGQTMTLTADEIGLLMEVPSLDVKRNVFAAALVSAIERGDVDEMSFAFRAIRQEWNDDYTQRRILELQLFDVSGVGRPANPATIIGVRSDDAIEEQRDEFPLSLALAQVEALRYHS
jgi:HK97 family phage prohead protease